jgi:periplasmic protein TonB
MKTNQLSWGGTAAPHLATLNDIVFECRNKEYGAYDLRQRYPQTLRKALLIGVAIVLIMIAIPSIYAKFSVKSGTERNREVTTWVELGPTPDKPEIEPVQPIVPPKQSTVAFPPYVVETDAPDNTDVPPNENFDEAQPASVTYDGDEGGEVEIVAPADNTPPSVILQTLELTPEIMETYRVDIQPEFPGGINGFKEFLSKNLKYPSAAQSAGVSGKVFLQFTVNQDGSLDNISAIKGIGFGCDEEAIRVMKLMPSWKPGRQSGRAVRVKFNLPIVFTLE